MTARKPLPCIRCGRRLKSCVRPATLQPSNAVMFESNGNYGSEAFDPLTGFVPGVRVYAYLNLCDACWNACRAVGRIRVVDGDRALPKTKYAGRPRRKHG